MIASTVIAKSLRSEETPFSLVFCAERARITYMDEKLQLRSETPNL